MKPLFLLLLTMVTFFPALAQESTKEQTRAKTGDEVWVIVNYIKEDSKPAFEQWIKDVFYPALHKSQDPMVKEQLKATRWLEPARQNEDKSWTYVWIMDPVVPKADYDMESLLNTAYGEEKGKAYWEKYQTFWSKPLEAHILKQTAY